MLIFICIICFYTILVQRCLIYTSNQCWLKICNMTAKFGHLVANPVEFVVAGTNDSKHSSGKVADSSSLQATLSGEQVKKLYEDIVNQISSKDLSSSSKSKSVPNVRKSRHRKRKAKDDLIHHNFTEKEFFQACQTGDIATVQKCINVARLDVNSSDAFSWTPLMIAAHAGHGEVVLLLLSEGAEWIDKVDGSGYDARDLACLGNHSDIVELLTNTDHIIKKRKVSELMKKCENTIKREKLWCQVCKSYYYASSSLQFRDAHSTSTLHLISDKDFPPKCHSHFYLPHSNKGFQLLKKEGWDGESGLGPTGTGQKYPVKTVLKRDKLGIGSSTLAKAKVTHFKAYDETAVKGRIEKKIFKTRAARRKHAKWAEENEKQKEVNFRRLFH